MVLDLRHVDDLDHGRVHGVVRRLAREHGFDGAGVELRTGDGDCFSFSGDASVRSQVFGDITPCGTPSAGMSPLRLKSLTPSHNPFAGGYSHVDGMFQSLFGSAV